MHTQASDCFYTPSLSTPQATNSDGNSALVLAAYYGHVNADAYGVINIIRAGTLFDISIFESAPSFLTKGTLK